jgi:hypothetical protein
VSISAASLGATIRFQSAGTFVYVGMLHAGMVGTMVIESNDQSFALQKLLLASGGSIL